MRGAGLLGAFAAVIVLTACKAEPDFDEKFDQRSRELTEKARQIEADANAQLAAAREADRAEAERAKAERDELAVGAGE